MRRLSTLGAVLGVLALLLLTGAGTASAEPPSRLADRITDKVGVLGDAGAAQISASIERLRTEKGIDLFVVYVASFDGADPQGWADDAARRSQLGVEDVLLAVATGDRAYAVSVADGFSVSESVVDDARTAAEDRLAVNDWAGAAVVLADGLRAGGGGGGIGVVAIGVGGVAVVGGGAYLLNRRRKSRAAASAEPTPTDAPRDEFSDVSTDDLAYRGSAALIEVDDAVRTSELELAAARAHFGDEAVAGFATAVEESRADMLRGFGLRQQLDDDVPEDEPTTRAMLADIIRACRSADERLDAQVAAFDRLRNLEATAPEYVAGLATRRNATAAHLPQADSGWAALQARYAASALDPVAGNLDHARKLLAVAATELDAARAELAAAAEPNSGRSAAVVSGRAAEDAITQAETLIAGIPRLDAALVAAAEQIASARAETEQDLAEARALTASGGDPSGLAPLVARAEAALISAAQAERAALPDPLAALRLVDEADEALDRGLAQARQDRAQRAAVLDQTLLTAGSAVASADDFITTRRGAVGGEARTRLAEAQRHLQAARSGGDPAVALREAQAADAMAQQALQLARSDVSQWSGSQGSGSQGSGSQGSGSQWSGSQWSGSQGSGRGGGGLAVDLGSLILGGILSGALGGGGGGGGGGRSPGSFGGSSSRGRRGGGGRF